MRSSTSNSNLILVPYHSFRVSVVSFFNCYRIANASISMKTRSISDTARAGFYYFPGLKFTNRWMGMSSIVLHKGETHKLLMLG
jgi:hypothetical protein